MNLVCLDSATGAFARYSRAPGNTAKLERRCYVPPDDWLAIQHGMQDNVDPEAIEFFRVTGFLPGEVDHISAVTPSPVMPPSAPVPA